MHNCDRCHELPVEGTEEWERFTAAFRRYLSALPQGHTVVVSDELERRGFRGISVPTQAATSTAIVPVKAPSTTSKHRNPCLHFYSTHGCSSGDMGRPCAFSHNVYEIASPEWYNLRRRLRQCAMDQRYHLHKPLPYLAMKTGFKIAGDNERSPEGTLVHYCLLYFTSGCFDDVCQLCHTLPIESSEEWATLRDAIKFDVIERNLLDLPDFDLHPEVKRRLRKGHNSDQEEPEKVQQQVEDDVKSLPSRSSKTRSNNSYGPCIHYYSITGCPHTHCMYTHDNTCYIATADWMRLRPHLCDTTSKFPYKCMLIPQPYLGLGVGYTDVYKDSYGNNNTIVSYCMNFFSKQSCPYTNTITIKNHKKNNKLCTQCHDVPSYGTLEYTNLRAKILGHVADNPGIELSEKTREYFDITAEYTCTTATDKDTNIVINDTEVYDVEEVLHDNELTYVDAEALKGGTGNTVSAKLNKNEPYSNNNDKENNHVNIKLESDQERDEYKWIREKLGQLATDTIIPNYTTTADVKACIRTDTVLHVTHIDTDSVPTGSTLSTMLTSDSICMDIVESTAQHTTTAALHRFKSPDRPARSASAEAKAPGGSDLTRTTLGPCAFFQCEQGCSVECGRDHIQPEVGSEAWRELRRELKRCVKSLKCGHLMESRTYLGMKKGFTDPKRDENEPLVDYCKRSFTTLGCPCEGGALKCTLCHHLPVEGSSEWSLLKRKLIAYVQHKLHSNPDVDYTPEVKARGVTKAKPTVATPKPHCHWSAVTLHAGF